MAEELPLASQRSFWNGWNTSHRAGDLHEISRRQAEVVFSWLDRLGRRDLDIIEIGCGTGWLSCQLSRYGSVVATDLADEVVARAAARCPEVQFSAGDFMDIDFGARQFDVAVSLEVLSHVADQPAFVRKASSLLRPDGRLMLATQNRPVLERFNNLPPPGPGQLRRWVDRHELRALLSDEFDIESIASVTPIANHGLMRLVNSHKLNKPIRAVLGTRVDHAKERLGLGWTLMALAIKRSSSER